MMEAIGLLDLKPEETGLFWTARLLYLLPHPLHWTSEPVSSQDKAFHFVQRTGREVNTTILPPSLVYVDRLVDRLRKNEYRDIDITSKTTYFYQNKQKKAKEIFTDDRLLQDFNSEKERYLNSRPSLRNFWPDVHKAHECNKLFNPPPIEGEVVYGTEEKGTKSSYMAYQATGMVAEQKMEQFWLDKQNQQLQEKREAEEFIHFMKDWASAKQRLKSEISRKAGQGYSGSQYDKRAFRLTSKVTIQK